MRWEVASLCGAVWKGVEQWNCGWMKVDENEENAMGDSIHSKAEGRSGSQGSVCEWMEKGRPLSLVQ